MPALFAVCAGAVTAVPGKAGAQNFREEASRTEARRGMSRFSECALRRHNAGVQTLLGLEPDSPEFRDQLPRVAMSDCMSGIGSGNETQLRFQSNLFRGGLYEALYHRYFRAAPAGFDQVPPLAYPWQGATEYPAARQANVQMMAIGECVVRAAPGDAHALLASRIGTDAEQAATAAVSARLAGCLPSGVTFTFSRTVLRGLVAEALYRLSTAASQRETAG